MLSLATETQSVVVDMMFIVFHCLQRAPNCTSSFSLRAFLGLGLSVTASSLRLSYWRSISVTTRL